MTQREQLQREIASILDHPSVYMGGPSARNMALADRIMRHLTKSTATTDDRDLEIGRLQAHKRAQAEDIITLGRMVGKLEAEIERLRAALKGLVDRLDYVHADLAYRSVWTVNHIHCGPYTGPTYTADLEKARHTVEQSDKIAGDGK